MGSLSEGLTNKKFSIAVVGLGYVGLPIAMAFAKQGLNVIGFDVSAQKVEQLESGHDCTGEIKSSDFMRTDLHITFTNDAKSLTKAAFIIVAVPTPVDENRTPDLTPLKKASELIGNNICKGTYIVYESTVYPGVTEDVCVPVLENASKFSWKDEDFFVGYSPERINPGDKEHTITKIIKIVSGQNDEVKKQVADVYRLIIEAGVYEAESIKVAEAAKVIENTQRDLNIALMNELSIIFEKIGINTEAVLAAAGSKWNFLKFHPGLVGGHCIGVDPYYLTTKAEQLGYHPQVVLAGRRINDSMGAYIGQQTVKQMIKAGHGILGSKVLVMGLTFKENVPDFRNSRVIDIIKELKAYGIRVLAYDPYAHNQASTEFDVEVVSLNEIHEVDAIVVATPHTEFKKMSLNQYKSYCRNIAKPVFIDVRWIINSTEAEKSGFHYWRL